MADTTLYVIIDQKSWEETRDKIDELVKRLYPITALLRRSWLLRRIFGVDLKKLEAEIYFK